MKDRYSDIIHKYTNGEIDFSELKNQLSDEDFQYWKDTLELLEEFPDSNFDTESEFEKLIQKRNRRTQSKTNFTKYIRIAAAVIILLTSAVLVDSYFNQNKQITTIAYNSSLRENIIVLPDSSKVYLNKDASVSYNAQDWVANRTINLKGEAYFEVEEGDNFIVSTQLGSVQVLGTTFNVYEKDNTFSVTCYTGKVRVNYNTNKILLTSGQSYTSTINNVNAIKAMKPQWLSRQSIFEATPLIEVIKDIEKLKNIRIDLNLDKTYRFTGGYQHEQKPEDILSLISKSLGLNYRKINENHFELVNN